MSQQNKAFELAKKVSDFLGLKVNFSSKNASPISDTIDKIDQLSQKPLITRGTFFFDSDQIDLIEELKDQWLNKTLPPESKANLIDLLLRERRSAQITIHKLMSRTSKLAEHTSKLLNIDIGHLKDDNCPSGIALNALRRLEERQASRPELAEMGTSLAKHWTHKITESESAQLIDLMHANLRKANNEAHEATLKASQLAGRVSAIYGIDGRSNPDSQCPIENANIFLDKLVHSTCGKLENLDDLKAVRMGELPAEEQHPDTSLKDLLGSTKLVLDDMVETSKTKPFDRSVLQTCKILLDVNLKLLSKHDQLQHQVNMLETRTHGQTVIGSTH